MSTFHNEKNVESDKRQKLDNHDIPSRDALDDAVLAALAFPSMTERRRNIEIPHEQTCQWIYSLHEYQNWTSQSSGLLWIKGKPGAGKSTLMSHLYSALAVKNGRSSDGSVCLEFFFNARGTPMDSSPLGMFRSLSSQLFYHDVNVREMPKALYQDKLALSGNGPVDWQRPELQQMFTNMVLTSAEHRSLTIFIDALDEAGEHDAAAVARYFHTMNKTIKNKSLAIKICISSRHYPVPPSDKTALEVHVEQHNHADIESFVGDYINDYIDCEDDNYNDLKALVPDLAKMANGVFQWARLVMPLVGKRINDGDGSREIRDWLPQVSTTLDKVYEYILERTIDQEYKLNSLRLFQWVCLASQPLSLADLRYAVASHDLVADPLPSSTYDELPSFVQTDETMRRRIRSWSGGLIEVVPQAADNYITYDRQIARPIHLSVNNFWQTRGYHLLSQACEQNNRPCDQASYIAKGLADETMACYHGSLYWCCVKHIASLRDKLSFLDIPTWSDMYKYREHRLFERQKSWRMVEEQFPFTRYAVKYVLEHAKKAHRHRHQEFKREVQLLSHIVDSLDKLREAQYYDDSPCDEALISPLHVSAAGNMLDLTRYLLGNTNDRLEGHDANTTALHIASWYGHFEIVKTLVEAGATVNMITTHHATPLGYAAGRGHMEIFQWLRKHGASLDSFVAGCETPLYTAAENGNALIIKICLESGANVNAVGGRYGNLLQAASARGHIKIAKMLIERGADVRATGGAYDTALTAASAKGYIDIVKMLAEAGADLHAQVVKDVDGQAMTSGNALQAASASGHTEIVLFLLESGADVNAQCEPHSHALIAATMYGHTEIVRILIKHGANVNAKGQDHSFALWNAAAGGNLEMVEMLVEAGADIHAQVDADADTNVVQLGTALYIASSNVNEDVVRSLLDLGADANARGGKYGYALTAVSRVGYGDDTKRRIIMKMLLDAGANVNAVAGIYYGTAINAAACHENPDLVKILIEAGADVNSGGGEYGTPLGTASDRGCPDVVKLLLENGADVNAVGEGYNTALQAAAITYSDEVGIPRMLIEFGADVNILGGLYGSALHAAVAYGRRDTIKMLLEAGADVAPLGENGYTILYRAVTTNDSSSDIVKMLLKAGADPNASDSDGRTPLYGAVVYHKRDMVEMLLKAGADPNARSWLSESTLLEHASGEIARLLLEAGAVPVSDHRSE